MGYTNKENALATLKDLRASAIIRTKDKQLASDAMHAAVEGGFRLVEFTLTTPGALELIATFAKRRDLLVGAGPVMDPSAAHEGHAAPPVVSSVIRRSLAPPVWS